MSEAAVPESVQAPAPLRARPAINEDNAYFWEGVDAGELRIQRCTKCQRRRHPSTPCCPNCNSFDWDWVVASGHGTVYSFVVFHHPVLPAFEAPYTVAVVELEEGQRIVSQVVGIPPDEVSIGLDVEAHFVAVDSELTLPLFRPTTADMARS